MSQQMNMSGMMGMGGVNMGGGPGAPGAQGAANTGTPGSAPSQNQMRQKFHTFIYDYFLKTQRYELARSLLNSTDIDLSAGSKQSPNRKEVNGIHDSIDADSKDDVKKPDDLPLANVPAPTDSPFLYDWFCQFWDLYEAQRGKGSAASRNFLQHSQRNMMAERRMRADPQLQANMGGMRNGMMPNGMPVPQDMAKRMLMQGRGNPAQMQQMQHNARLMMQQQQQQQQQTQMQREGSAIDINGPPRPQSPGSGDAAPSPKRQRLEGSFNGAPIGPMGAMGRGPPGPGAAMPGQQLNSMQLGIPQAKTTQQVEYSQGLRQQMTNAMISNTNKGLPANAPAMSQGSPAMDPVNADFMNGTQLRPGPAGAQAGAGGNANSNSNSSSNNNNSNHALQDYQMQLMLLEQQNKKRLLMARQEQDNMTNGPGGPVPPGQPGAGAFAPNMSPQGSRTGLSPNSGDQMKRGTPKMSQGVVPSPTPDGGMPQGRASPIPGFDAPQMNPNMPQNMFPQMNKMGMVGPNGQMMPPSSHPGMTGPMNPQQMEMFARQAQQNGGRMPNGFMPQGPPQMMPGQQPGPPMQQPPNMTPQQRNAMPPPPAPVGDPGRGTQPPSPQQQPAPPTPSQSNKANPKGKKDPKSNKKAPGKKGNTAATPVSEADQPPTPTPAPPITPTSTQGFPPKNGQATNQPQQPGGQMPMSQPQGQPDLSVGGGPFGNLDGNDFSGMNLDFGNLEGPDVLDNFDFDSFLNNEAGDGNFGFDTNMGFDSGLEAGGDV